jgi:hypothetical protein
MQRTAVHSKRRRRKHRRDAQAARTLEDAWARIGVLLALLQHVERAINVSLAWSSPDQPGTLEQLLAVLEKSKQKKTPLGGLLKTLGKRTNVEIPRFISTFVDDRNRFVHRLFAERGYNINNPKHVSRIRKFVDSLTDRATLLDFVFHKINEFGA